MKILALESSAKAASVALCDGEKLIAQYRQASGLTHSRTLLAMTEDLLKNTETAVEQIDAFAVAGGPGSFTGIRIGMAAAKGLAWGSEKPLCSVSTLEAMAWHCSDDRVTVCPVMDARRSQVYNALFTFGPDGPVRLTEDRAISLEELVADAGRYEAPFWFVGDGAALCAARFTEEGLPFIMAPEPLRLPSAWGVAAAARKGPFLDPADAEPNYLRLSQAERERLARLAAEER
ncbi:MAG: tRNA (adenosine(37)-N6)-threonylcarbamoyltransferase complex dimerization subunit type 1 TsaB [Oscillospiraceae bacterium]|nr:tRNA (adenosine(37)-N6)-threonylcarbamoyltransferase complex dimerization subunit type 1 TsaB [Oscillospiraceae bacterium]